MEQKMNCVDSQESSGGLKCGSEDVTEQSNSQDSDNGESVDTANEMVRMNGYKRRLTEKEDDNRLHYLKTIDTRKRKNGPTSAGNKVGQSTAKGNQGATNTTSTMKYNAGLGYIKDKNMGQAQTRRDKGDRSLHVSSIFSPGQKETLHEDPDPEHQNLQQREYLSEGDKMEISACMDNIRRKVNFEISKGSPVTLGAGPVTVFCLDTSESMEGLAFGRMISIAIKIVNKIRKVSLKHAIEENIGVTTFGRMSGVRLFPTNQHDKVKDVILSLHTKGPSPMFEGIHMALAAVTEGNDRRFKLNGIPFENRIILISDGKATPDHWQLIGDYVNPNYDKAKLFVNKYMDAAGRLVHSSGHKLYFILVGDFRNGPLERAASMSGGHIIQTNDPGELPHFTSHQLTAARQAFLLRNLGMDEDREPYLRAMNAIESTTPGDPNFDQCGMDVLTLALKFSKCQIQGASNEKGDVMEEVNTYMPCIGTRVRRGPNWVWGDQDGRGPGTVVGHDTDREVWVEWDVGGYRNTYGYLPRMHQVRVVEEERVLAAHEGIAVGCKVKRGRDWKFGDDDGGEGTVGVVCRVHPDQTIHVRWPNKTVRRYQFGASGRFEVELIIQREPDRNSKYILPHSTASTLPPRRRREANTEQQDTEARTDISVEDMNRLNERK